MADVSAELFYDGVWQDITGDVYGYPRADVAITRGRADEASQADPSTCSLQLNNRDGKYSVRNPTSPLFGKIGRNTPLRVRIGAASNQGMELTGHPGSYASTPDDPSLDITGDIDIRLQVKPERWPVDPDALHELGFARKWEPDGNQRSWGFWVDNDGLLTFDWSPDGTSQVEAFSAAPVPVSGDAELLVRVTLEVNNAGIGGWIATFYTADPATPSTWVQLDQMTAPGTPTSVFASTAPLEVGRVSAAGEDFPFDGSSVDAFQGLVRSFTLLNGIDGTTVAQPDFTAQDATEFVDASGRPWTLHGSAVYQDPSLRFAGEVSEWPVRWTPGGTDIWVPIEAAGPLRRLGQGADPLRSPLYRDLTTRGRVVAYWPMEDGGDSATLASAVAGHPAMNIRGDVSLASDDTFVASAPLPTFNAGGTVGARVSAYTTATIQRFACLVHVPADGVPSSCRLFAVHTDGGHLGPTSSVPQRWAVRVNPDGTLNLSVTGNEGAILETLDITNVQMNGLLSMVMLALSPGLATTGYELTVVDLSGADPVRTIHLGSIAGQTFDLIERVNGPRGFDDPNGLALGHFVVISGGTDRDTAAFQTSDVLVGWQLERAAERIRRLSSEEPVTATLDGITGDSEQQGPQGIDTFLNIVASSAETDLGILSERLDNIALRYRTRADLYNQPPVLTLDYANGDLAPPLEPTDDDQHIRNDVTVTRPIGSSAHVVQETGTLSIQSPPNGVGRYDTSVDVNVASDGRLPHHAGWRLHLGTVDELRLPVVTVNLTHPRMAPLIPAVMGVREGDLIRLTNLPSWMPTSEVDLIVQGSGERINAIEHVIAFNCSPATPWQVAVAEDDTLGRADTAGSELAAAIGTTNTSLTVATTAGPLWTTADEPFDIEAGGEVMTVTAVTGATSPQTFTVTRSVNGVVKAHDIGAQVRLAQPAIAAL